jgi:hypothetical protein
MNRAAVTAFSPTETEMPSDVSLIAILQKLYAGDTQLHVSCGDDGWEIGLGDATHAYATRKFKPDDIAELPQWIETESAKPQFVAFMSRHEWPRVGHLRIVK